MANFTNVRAVSYNVMYALYYGLLNKIKCLTNVQLIPCNSSPVNVSFKLIYLDNVQSASVTDSLYLFLVKKVLE